MENIHKTANTAMAAARNGAMSEKPMFEVTGVMLWREGRVDKLPSQLG